LSLFLLLLMRLFPCLANEDDQVVLWVLDFFHAHLRLPIVKTLA
jgi:hypothetical protein